MKNTTYKKETTAKKVYSTSDNNTSRPRPDYRSGKENRPSEEDKTRTKNDKK